MPILQKHTGDMSAGPTAGAVAAAAQPTISVAIPVFNAGQYLAAAIRSVFAQRHLPYELVLIDDRSTDGSFDKLQLLAAQAPPDLAVRVIQNEHQLGLVGNWNRAIQETRGDYILIFHQDDELRPAMIQQVRSALREHPDIGLVHTGFECREEDRHRLPRVGITQSGRMRGSEFVASLAKGNFVCCPSVVVARWVYDRAGLFDARFKFAADQEMWLRAGLHTDVFYIGEPLVSYRIHDAMTTTEFMTGRAARGHLETAVAPAAALTRYPSRSPWALKRSAVGGAVWEIRRFVRHAPTDAAWAARVVFAHPLQAMLLLTSHFVFRLGLRVGWRSP